MQKPCVVCVDRVLHQQPHLESAAIEPLKVLKLVKQMLDKAAKYPGIPTTLIGNVWIRARGIRLPLVDHLSPLPYRVGRKCARKVISRFALRRCHLYRFREVRFKQRP